MVVRGEVCRRVRPCDFVHTGTKDRHSIEFIRGTSKRYSIGLQRNGAWCMQYNYNEQIFGSDRYERFKKNE